MEHQIVRKHTREIQIGNRKIGGGHPILIQSMTNTHTEDIKGTIAQIQQLTAAGCEIIRCAVPTMEAAEAIKEIKKGITIPLVADTAQIKSALTREISEQKRESKQS